MSGKDRTKDFRLDLFHRACDLLVRLLMAHFDLLRVARELLKWWVARFDVWLLPPTGIGWGTDPVLY